MLETGDAATSLRQLLSWSHRQLTAPAAAMFALLGIHCGPDITVPAAASLAGVPRTQAGRALAELADASLLAEHRPGRYVMHDLVRGYAAAQARQDLGETEIGEAIARSLDHYLHTMVISFGYPILFTPAPPAPGVVPERLADDAELLEWADAERQVLLQATSQAAAAGLLTRAWQILASANWLLGGHGYWADWRPAGQAVLAAAVAAGDQHALGWAYATIGWYSTLAGSHDEARAHQHQALECFRQAGDRDGQAWAHLFAARPAARHGDWAKAAMHGEQALALFRQVGERAGEVSALHRLGEYHAQLGSYDWARAYARRALELDPEGNDPMSPARAWGVLGLVHSRLGENRQAISCYRRALACTHEPQTRLSRKWLAGLLAGFGDALQAAGDLPAAAGAWRQALQILDDLGLPDNRRLRGKLEQAALTLGPGAQRRTR